MAVRTDRRWDLAHDKRVVWEAMCRVGEYRNWWRWLREFDGVRLAQGERWRCVVRPQMPYRVRFAVELATVVCHEVVVAHLAGDLEGWARLELIDDLDGCQLRLTSEISAEHGTARLLERWAPRLATAGHDWVLERGIANFRSVALAERD